MVILALALLVLGGCYAPALRDCTVTCAADEPSACADGQACTHGYCVADPATTCALDLPDARPPPPTDAMPDAHPVDPLTTRLHVSIMGRGRVDIEGQGSCATDCTVTITRDVQLRLTAVDLDQEFDRWTSAACQGQPKRCELIPGTPTVDVSVRFH
ncbi:MAG: hypothetical protein NT062_13610 [Proteobacteria bacterium]|nr:hypothetical protein [Pseudomonadota bacterium]